jgi:hypothetical protein
MIDTFRDVAKLCKMNLNPRTLVVHHPGFLGGSHKEYSDTVWFTEIVAFFKRAGLKQDDAWNVGADLEKMGFLTTLDNIGEPREDWVMRFLI